MNMQSPPTPALIIDAVLVERNVRRMADYAAAHGLALRPHTKTHKSLQVARLQMAAGAGGLTAAKVGEADVMAQAAGDVLLAYPAVDGARTERVARLAAGCTVRVAIDSQFAAEALASAARSQGSMLGILVDLDVGHGRTGVQSPEEALSLAQFVDRAAGLRLDGLLIYPGHIVAPPVEQPPLLDAVTSRLDETLDLWERHSLKATIVSGGSTPTAINSHRVPRLTEIRPGTYIYNDMTIVRGGHCSIEDCAARIECTVVSTAVPGQVVLDAGSKTLTSDLNPRAPQSGHGYVVEYPLARIAKLTEEHAQVDVRECPNKPKIGDRVTVIPNHICPCVNLQSSAWWREADGRLSPLPVDARGLLS